MSEPNDADSNVEAEWSAADIASIISGRDDARQASEVFRGDGSVQLSPGFQHDEGGYVIDPDFADILGLDYDDLVRRKVDMNRR